MHRSAMVTLLPPAPWGDVGPFEATVGLHGYLRCFGCDVGLLAGRTTQGAVILCCSRCKRIVDARRLDS
jgi:hypothetical protein